LTIHQLILRDSIAIQAAPALVWDALVNPAKTKLYMFGCEAISDWKTDSPLLWKAFPDGREILIMKGNIVEIERDRFLAYTMFDPNAGLDDIPENYLTVTYELYPDNGQTILTINQGDFAMMENGEQNYQEAVKNGGWIPILSEIKKLLEK